MFVDLTFVSPRRPYRIGDFTHFFPPGLILGEGVEMTTKVVAVE